MSGARVDLGSVTLQTYVEGPAQAPWLILSNSLGAASAMWDPQMAWLSTQFRVLRYDTRGHGGSDTAPGPYSFADLTGDVIGLMDHFGIAKAAFMGLSMGGMTALGLARDHPDRLTRIVVADGRADAPPPFRAMWDDRIAKVEAGGLEAIADGTLASWLTPDWHAANPEALAGVRRMVLANDPAGYVACCLALKELDYLKDLGALSTPALFVGGALDKGAAPEVMQAMADATPGGVYKQIPNAAHVANINAPDAFQAAVAEFLAADLRA